MRYVRWAHSAKQILHELVWNRKNQYLMINPILVRADQQAATGRKKGAPKTRLWGVPRASDNQDLPAGRRTGPVVGIHDHCRAGGRLHKAIAMLGDCPTEAVIADLGI